jgi:hypothetical protein
MKAGDVALGHVFAAWSCHCFSALICGPKTQTGNLCGLTSALLLKKLRPKS